MSVPTVEAAIEHYIQEHVIPSGGEERRARYTAAKGLRIFGAQTPIDEITRGRSRQYAEIRIAEGVKPATVRRELSMHQAAFNHARKEERTKTEFSFFMPPASAPRLEWLTHEQYRKIMLVPKSRREQLFLLLAFGTGARARAIEDATWDRVDLVARTIDYRVPGKVYKNKRRVVAPISDALLPRLIAAKAYHDERTPDCPYVIGVGERGKKSTTYHGIADVYRRAGIKVRAPRHIARHTFASWLLQNGVSIYEVAQLIGDTVAMVEKTYGHMQPKHLMKSINKLEIRT